jgi:glucose/arabinose dehydrogenase
VNSSGERGLLGIAFDPSFASNHFAYLYYTNPNAGGASWATGIHNQLSRFTVDDSNPQQPVFGNEAPILDWNTLSSATNHNGGAIHFGLDGMLYADAGDNVQTFTQGGQTYRVSQTLANLLGKQLRIDVSKFNAGVATRDDTTVGHLIPSDNPFVGTATGINQLIYVLGLRNPYTFAVQPGTGKIFVNDVGENTWEEIDQSIAGGNYGWSGGNTDGFGQSPPGPGTYHDPLLAYNHTGGPAGGGIAIVGGTFYNPATTQFPSSYVGKYFYEDLGGNWIRVFDPAHPGTAGTPDTSTGFATGLPSGLRDLKVDSLGSLYCLAGNGSLVNKISYHVNQPPTLAAIADQTIPQGNSGTVTLQGSDPDGDPLTYSAVAQTLPYWLKQTYGIFQDPGGYYTNYRGQQEKYLRGTISANNYSDPNGYWYYILPNGDLFEFTPPYTNPALVGALVAHLGSAVYNDPSLLWNAQNTVVPTMLSIAGNVLTITPDPSYTGTFVIIASASDGQLSASRPFKVIVA